MRPPVTWQILVHYYLFSDVQTMLIFIDVLMATDRERGDVRALVAT